MKYIISENLENDCVYAYAAKEFWVYDKQACRWYTSGFCREQYERAKQKLSRLTPEDFLTDSSDYSLLDDYEIPSAALNALQEAVKSGKREAAPFENTNPTPADADASPCAPTASDAPPSPSQSAAADAQQGENDNLPEVCRGCQCATCGNEDCPTPCRQKSDEVKECEQLGPMGDDCEDYQPKEDAECLKTPAPNGDAAASTAASAAQEPQPEETMITQTSANSSSVPACPVDAGAATQSLSAADAASLAAEPAPAFDFGADAETNMALMQDAQVFMAGSMARVMAAKRAHDRTANNYRGSWGKWCDLVGISRDTGDNMVRVAEQFGNIQINGQNLIDVQPLKLLYATSKASTPPEIRERVENLDITTHKQYQEAMAQLKAERAAREKAEHDAQRYREDSEKAREAAHTYHCQYEQASQQRNALLDQQTEYISRIEAAEKETAAAQQRAAKAEAQGKKDAALVEKLQDIVLQRDNEVAEQKERADAAEIRAQQAENRPVEVAVQAPTEEQINAAAKQRTAMLEAQLHTLQTQRDDAEKRADAAENNAYLSAAEFADKAATIIDGIRASFWAMAKELPDADFNQALEPLDVAVSRIYNREWEDGWNDSWENNEEDDQ